MADTMTVGGVVWDRVQDRESEHWCTMVGTIRVDVYDDCNHTVWCSEINEDGLTITELNATNLQDAMREAVYDVTH